MGERFDAFRENLSGEQPRQAAKAGGALGAVVGVYEVMELNKPHREQHGEITVLKDENMTLRDVAASTSGEPGGAAAKQVISNRIKQNQQQIGKLETTMPSSILDTVDPAMTVPLGIAAPAALGAFVFAAVSVKTRQMLASRKAARSET